MKRWLYFAYGVAAYAAFGVTYAYLCGFTGNLFVPKSIDAPATTTPWAGAAVVNVALLLGFGLQHSVMARPAFKRVWTRIVPQPIERATYNFAACAALAALVAFWQPMGAIVWDVHHPAGRAVLWALFAAGWLLVPAVSFMISHFDLFGLRQVWLHLLGREQIALPFRTPGLYAHIRHPLYVGWAIAFWATPTMTVGHLLYAAVLTGYMALAALVEERDLVAHFGQVYENYRRSTPRYIPRLGIVRLSEVTTASRRGVDPLEDSVGA
jgi:protein-S-isoprenylcysteine O-methyltransferase Ste14